MNKLKQINSKNLPHIENKIIREVYYKSRKSYENQREFFRKNFNQVRENKEAKYKKVDTREFQHLIEEMIRYEHMEYICAGLNSFEREVVVIDCDDEDKGEKTLKLLEIANLEPHLMKIKPNGHSQFYFFINKFYIGECNFINGKYHEHDFYDNHQKWKWLNRMMNVLFNGDVGYTGYNCQNPFYKNAEVYEFRSLNNLYTVDELYDKVNELLSNQEILHYVNETIYKFYSERKTSTKTATAKILTRVHFLDEEEAERLAEESREELKRKLKEIAENRKVTNKEEVNQLVNEIEHISENSINKRIFVLCSQICKSFWKKHLLHNKDYFEEIINTCLSNWNYQDNALGYTFYELKQRITNDVRQIQYKDLHNTMLWHKVGYTNIQRTKSLQTRRKLMTIKRTRITHILNNNIDNYKGLSLNTIIKFIMNEYKLTYNENISMSTIRLYLIKQYKNIIFYIKTHTNKTISTHSYSHNNKLKSIGKKIEKLNGNRVLSVLYMYNHCCKQRNIA